MYLIGLYRNCGTDCCHNKDTSGTFHVDNSLQITEDRFNSHQVDQLD